MWRRRKFWRRWRRCLKFVPNAYVYAPGLSVAVFDTPPPPGPPMTLDWLNVKDFGAVGNGTTNDAPAIQAALNACDPNRGGTVYFPHPSYRVATGLTVPYHGTWLVGNGLPGMDVASGGSTEIVSDNGITAITCHTGSHSIRGFGFRNLRVCAKGGATSGHGIHVINAESCVFENVTVAGYVNGRGLFNDAGGGNSQYWSLYNFGAAQCLTGYEDTGPANGARFFGGYFAGATTPQAGSRAVWLKGSDTAKFFGTVVQGFAIGFDVQSMGAGYEWHGCRTEFCNRHFRFGSSARRARIYGGTISNFILGNPGAGSIGVEIAAGAEDILCDLAEISSVTTPFVDAGTRTRYGSSIAGKRIAASSLGVIIGKVPYHDPTTGQFIGYLGVTS